MRLLPDWKVYSAAGEYRAAFKAPEEAAVLVSFLGAGATIRWGHRRADVCWQEGRDGAAADSYDHVADTCYGRIDELKFRHGRPY